MNIVVPDNLSLTRSICWSHLSKTIQTLAKPSLNWRGRYTFYPSLVLTILNNISGKGPAVRPAENAPMSQIGLHHQGPVDDVAIQIGPVVQVAQA
jgi:hypothetical protein